MHIFNKELWAVINKDKFICGNEILVEYPPEQRKSKEVLICDENTSLIDGCKWTLINDE